MTDAKAWATTRATQLVARYVASILIGVLSYGAEQGEADALTIATAVVAVALFGADLLIHTIRKRREADPRKTRLERWGL